MFGAAFQGQSPRCRYCTEKQRHSTANKGQLGSQYNHCKYEDSPNEYYVLANDKSNLYKRLFSNNPDINKFIEKHVKDWKAEQATTRKIETLVEFLKRNKFVKNYKEGEIKVL